MSLHMNTVPIEIVVMMPSGEVRVATQVTSSQADRMLAYARALEVAATRTQALSPREQQVLDLLSRGRAYKQVAEELGVSVDTVRTYVRTLYRKLGAHSVTEALSQARGLGLV